MGYIVKIDINEIR